MQKARRRRSDSIITREKILTVAEKLFAERGIDNVSLNEIVTAAGQRNKSAIIYHFENKETIVMEILKKHERGIIRQMDKILTKVSVADKPTLRNYVTAIVIPIFNKLDDPDGGVQYLRLMPQILGHPQYANPEWILKYLNDSSSMIAKMTRSLATATGTKQRWLSFYIFWTAALFHALADYSRIKERENASLELPSPELFVQHLIDVLVAILNTPFPEEISQEFLNESKILNRKKVTVAEFH